MEKNNIKNEDKIIVSKNDLKKLFNNASSHYYSKHIGILFFVFVIAFISGFLLAIGLLG